MVLQKQNGKQVTVPVAKLSAKDQKFLKLVELKAQAQAELRERRTLFFEKQDWDTAIAGDYTEAIRVDPTNAKAYLTPGESLTAIRANTDKAIADCTEAIRLDPNLAQGYRIRGNAYLEKSEIGKAIVDFTAAIRGDPNDAKAYYIRGIAYEKIGQKAKAAADFAKADKLGYKP